MTWALDQLRMIREAIALERKKDRGKGTLVSLDPSSLDGQASLDPDPSPMPVKVAGSVRCAAGDRVVLLLVDSVWWVIAAEPRRTLNTVTGTAVFVPASTSITSASFTDMPGSPSVQFTKRYDETLVRLEVNCSGYVAGAVPTPVAWGLNIGGADYELKLFWYNVASQHLDFGGARSVSAIPAGTYTVTGRWRRPSGTGSPTITNDDQWMICVAEQAAS